MTKSRLLTIGKRSTLPAAALTAVSLLPAPARAAEPRRLPAAKAVLKDVTVTEGTNVAATVSPDGKTIIMDLQEALWSLPMTGGPAKLLTDPMLEPSRPDWSPTGNVVAFQGYKSGNFHIWIMKPDGTGVRQLTDGFGDDREPRVSPDGTTIAFASDRAMKGDYDIWVVDIATGALSQRTSRAKEEYGPTWMPDGKSIAFVSGTGVARGHGANVSGMDIEAVDGAGTIRAIYSQPKSGEAGPQAPHIESPSFSPEGKLSFVLVNGSRSELMIDGKKAGSAKDVFPFYPTWLSGSKLLYTGDGKILKTDLRSGDTTSIPFQATFHINRPGYPHRVYDFDETSAHTVKGIVHPALSPDGKQVVFEALNQLWLMPLGGKPVALTSDTFFKQDPAWSPDGKSILFSTDADGFESLHVMDVATKAVRRLTHDSGHSEIMGTFSPDCKEIAYHDQDGVTYIADVASGTSRKVLDEYFGPSQPSWSADGKTLILTVLKPYNMRFREGTSQLLTLDLASGKFRLTEPAPFTSVVTRGYNGPTYSPDGKEIVFVMKDFLYLMPVDNSGIPSGAATQLNHETSDSPSWSGDSKTILYLSNGKLRTVAARGDGTPAPVAVDLNWHRVLPDSRTVIHAGTLWNGLSEATVKDVDITVVKNRIVSIAPHSAAAKAAANTRYIEAGDKFVTPGLWESHNHMYGAIQESGDASGRLWLSYGFTTLQSQGDEGYIQEEVRESLAANQRIGPRYFATSELIDGNRIFYPTNRTIYDDDQMKRELERARALDVDNYKTYVRLTNARQKQVMDFAHNTAGTWVASHYGLPGLMYGMDGMTHVSATSRWGYAYTRSLTGVTYKDVTALFPAAGMWEISTAFAGTALYAIDPHILEDKRLATLDQSWAQKALEEARDRAVKTTPGGNTEQLKREDDTVAALYHAGGDVMAGIDSFSPGLMISLILGIRAEALNGLKPWEALQTATIIPARQFGYGKDLGSIEPGKLADIDIVDGNPLQNITDMTKIAGVMVNGRYYTPDELMKPFAK